MDPQVDPQKKGHKPEGFPPGTGTGERARGNSVRGQGVTRGSQTSTQCKSEVANVKTVRLELFGDVCSSIAGGTPPEAPGWPEIDKM